MKSAYHSRWHTSPLSHKCPNHMKSSFTLVPTPHFPLNPMMCSLFPDCFSTTWCQQHSKSICFPQISLTLRLISNMFAEFHNFHHILSAAVRSCDQGWCFAEIIKSMCVRYYDFRLGWTFFIRGSIFGQKESQGWAFFWVSIFFNCCLFFPSKGNWNKGQEQSSCFSV